ncbi:hypothetical protein KFL_016360010, partial [Klebsormidium nitens]
MRDKNDLRFSASSHNSYDTSALWAASSPSPSLTFVASIRSRIESAVEGAAPQLGQQSKRKPREAGRTESAVEGAAPQPGPKSTLKSREASRAVSAVEGAAPPPGPRSKRKPREAGRSEVEEVEAPVQPCLKRAKRTAPLTQSKNQRTKTVATSPPAFLPATVPGNLLGQFRRPQRLVEGKALLTEETARVAFKMARLGVDEGRKGYDAPTVRWILHLTWMLELRGEVIPESESVSQGVTSKEIEEYYLEWQNTAEAEPLVYSFQGDHVVEVPWQPSAKELKLRWKITTIVIKGVLGFEGQGKKNSIRMAGKN